MDDRSPASAADGLVDPDSVVGFSIRRSVVAFESTGFQKVQEVQRKILKAKRELMMEGKASVSGTSKHRNVETEMREISTLVESKQVLFYLSGQSLPNSKLVSDGWSLESLASRVEHLEEAFRDTNISERFYLQFLKDLAARDFEACEWNLHRYSDSYTRMEKSSLSGCLLLATMQHIFGLIDAAEKVITFILRCRKCLFLRFLVFRVSLSVSTLRKKLTTNIAYT